MTQENIISILIAAAVVAVLGALIGIILSIFAKVFAVKTDPKVEAIREALPGNNCGGCGYSGCDGLASAIASGSAACNACPVGGEVCAQKIAEIMGENLQSQERRVAFVRCSGSCDQTRFKYEYFGDNDCHRVAMAPGRGSKTCAYGCTGLGSCVAACPFDAIHIQDGRAVVDPKACRSCGKCVQACPNHLIELIPVSATYAVRCRSLERGKNVRLMCDAGCIGCGVCAKVCPEGAIEFGNNIAYIHQEKCIGCGKCASRCPAGVIVRPKGEENEGRRP